MRNNLCNGESRLFLFKLGLFYASTVRSAVSCTHEFDHSVTKFWPFENDGNENFDFFVEKIGVSKSTNDQSIWVSYQKLA